MNKARERRRGRHLPAVAAVTLCIGVACAAGLPADDSAQVEARVRLLAESFRCLVCQNQTLADSSADLAGDLRERIREQVRQGANDGEVRDYMVQRYGDFVLYRPPLKPLTWALWFGPFAALVAGAIALVRSILRRRRVMPRALDADERRRMDALLATPDERRAR